jgi:hypothetical protein
MFILKLKLYNVNKYLWNNLYTLNNVDISNLVLTISGMRKSCEDIKWIISGSKSKDRQNNCHRKKTKR